MAYAAVINLTYTIHRLLNFSRLSDLPYSFDNLDFPYEGIELLEEVVRKLDGRSMNASLKALYEKIREAAHGLEDALESILSKLIRIAQSDETIGNEDPSVHEEEVRQGIKSFVETVEKIKEEYIHELEYPSPDGVEDEDEESESSRIDFGGKKPKIVGSNSQVLITKIKDQLNTGYKSSELRVVSIVGVSGSGRSTFAWSLLCQAPPYLHKLRALVRIGPKYEFRDILLNILSQIDDTNAHKLLDSEGDEKIFEYLHKLLKGGDYLIALDDVRETQVWEYLGKLFPNENNGSRVVLTTHLEEVAVFAKSFCIHRTPILHYEESWNIISRVLFSKSEICPSELEKVGRKIAKNCKGHLFEVAIFAEILSDVDQTPEHWNKVAENFDADDTYDEISVIFKMTGDDCSIHPYYQLPPIMWKSLNFPDAYYNIRTDVFIYPTYVAVAGMAGIGKTAIVREVFDDQWISHLYDHRVWLTLGPKYEFKRILVYILAQLDPNVDEMHVEDDETLVKHISSILAGKRYLMVLDDIWDKHPLSYLSKLLQVIKCEVLLTTRILGVPLEYFGSKSGRVHKMQLLNEEESWSLLRKGVFGEELCPLELEKPGKLIAENCDGLPLMIVTVANLLLKVGEKTPKYWNEVAKEKNSLFKLAYLKISKILYPSYKNLNLEYRACFLYMAVFLVKCDSFHQKLLMLYNVEGIIPSGYWNSDNFMDYIVYLGKKCLVLTQDNDEYTTIRLHSVFWHFCAGEARNDKFFHVMKTRADGLAENIAKQRRLSVQNNVLFAIKDMHDLMASVSAARSLLCFGPSHQYQVPICLGLKFLKVVDALSIRFYEFPVGILNLVLLRYLALTYNGELPASISKLWNLEFLIIEHYMSIHFSKYLSYLPIEIWDMKELKRLEISESNLPDPPADSSTLLDRLTTLHVRAESVTKRILERIPNLEHLRIFIDLVPDHACELLFSFDHIFHLKQLNFFECFIINPDLRYVVVSAPAPFSMIRLSLKKLYLGGLGYSWEHIKPIALLPNLEELLLQCYAFQGAEWVMQEGYFKRLGILFLEDTDLVDWRADDSCHLLFLHSLHIGHCYKLKEIPWQSIPSSCNTKLVDCNPSAMEKTPENCVTVCSWDRRGKF